MRLRWAGGEGLRRKAVNGWWVRERWWWGGGKGREKGEERSLEHVCLFTFKLNHI